MPFGRYTCGFQWHTVLNGGLWLPKEGKIWEVAPSAKPALCCHLRNTNQERFRLLPNYFGACLLPLSSTAASSICDQPVNCRFYGSECQPTEDALSYMLVHLIAMNAFPNILKCITNSLSTSRTFLLLVLLELRLPSWGSSKRSPRLPIAGIRVLLLKGGKGQLSLLKLCFF